MNKYVKPLKAEDLLYKFDGDPTKEIAMLYPGTGMFQSISLDQEYYLNKDLTKINKTDETVIMYDGSIKLLEIDKVLLHKYIESLKEPSKLQGLNFLTYKPEYSAKIEYKITHDLRISGNAKGLLFWIDGTAVKQS